MGYNTALGPNPPRITCPSCGRRNRPVTRTGKIMPHDEPQETPGPVPYRCKASNKTLTELSGPAAPQLDHPIP